MGGQEFLEIVAVLPTRKEKGQVIRVPFVSLIVFSFLPKNMHFI